jgi:glycosyltransferase involved in cell wall biosynthesis
VTSGLIVFATPYYPPFGAGGAEFTASLHASLLADDGARVLVVTPNYGAAPREEQDGIEIVRYAFVGLDRPGQQVDARRFSSRRAQRQLADEIVRAAAGRAVHCVHAQHQYVAEGAAEAALRLGVPFIAHLRDTSQVCSIGALCLLEAGRDAPPAHCGLVQNLWCHQTRFVPAYVPGAGALGRVARLAPALYDHRAWSRRDAVYRRARRIAFASDGLRRLYAGLPPYADSARHRVVYAPVLPVAAGEVKPDLLPAPVRQARDEGRPLVLFVGKVSKGKGCDVMFEAWNRLAAAWPEARLVVAGNIDPAAWSIDRNRTLLLGFVDRAAVPALYDACDIVLLPSTWPEPLGWAVLDSARHGRPIVATAVGGIPEGVSDGETGLLVPRLDSAAMAAALDRLLRHPEEARRMGRRSFAQVERRFGATAVRDQLRALYRDIA